MYERKETWDEQAVEELKNSYNAILTHIGEDPTREGLLKIEFDYNTKMKEILLSSLHLRS